MLYLQLHFHHTTSHPMEKSTVYPFLFEGKVKGEGTVKIVIYVSGQRAIKTTGEKIKVADWDSKNRKVKPSHINHVDLNSLFDQKCAEYKSKILKFRLEGKTVVPDMLTNYDQRINFVAYFEKVKEQLSVSAGYRTKLSVDLKRLRLYAGSELLFHEITPEWLRLYEQWLRSKGDLENTGEPLSNNTVNGVFKRLRTIYYHAIKDGVVESNPFKKISFPKYIQGLVTHLTKEEMELIEAKLLQPVPDHIYLVGYYLLLGCYSGFRYSDWRRFNPGFIQGDRLILQAKKNNQLISMKMHTRLKRVVDILLTLDKIMSEQKTNKYLKNLMEICGINKDISTHTGRHSFGMQCAYLGISKEMTAERMGISLKTVDVYYRMVDVAVDKEFEKWDR